MSFLGELKRRRVFRVAVAYVVTTWLLLQVADIVLPTFSAPGWVMPTLTTLLGLGFPVAMALAWVYDITPQGIQRTGNVAAGRNDKALTLPAGPSIAVLAFRNLSTDPEQRLFAEAITNDIINGLTRTSSLRVVATGSAVAADDASDAPAEIARKLGVRYLLRGSVNRMGEQLRVTAQLTDTRDNLQIWSANYDRKLTANELFEVQDDIREQIVATLSDAHGVIFSLESEKNVNRPTESLDAYECLSVALAYDRTMSEAYHRKARDSVEKAVRLDPEFDRAWAFLSWLYTDEVVWGYNPKPDSMKRALKAAQRSVELAPNDYHNHWLLSRVHYFNGDKARFLAEAEKSLSLNANDGTTLGLIGCYLLLAGQWQRGAALIEKAKQLNPNHPDYYHFFLSAADLQRHDYAAALDDLRRMSLPQWPPALIFLAAANALAGNAAEARSYADVLRARLGSKAPEEAQVILKRMVPYAESLAKTVADGLAQAMAAPPARQAGERQPRA